MFPCIFAENRERETVHWRTSNSACITYHKQWYSQRTNKRAHTHTVRWNVTQRSVLNILLVRTYETLRCGCLCVFVSPCIDYACMYTNTAGIASTNVLLLLLLLLVVVCVFVSALAREYKIAEHSKSNWSTTTSTILCAAWLLAGLFISFFSTAAVAFHFISFHVFSICFTIFFLCMCVCKIGRLENIFRENEECKCEYIER